MNRGLKLLCACSGLMLVLGCSTPKIVDHIKIMSVLGIDKDDSVYRGTALYLNYLKDDDIVRVQGQGRTTELLLSAMNMQSPKTIQLGKLHMLVFSKDLAEAGVLHLIKTICNNPLISSNLIVAVSDVPVADMFKSIEGKHGDALPYHLIEQNVKTGNAPLTNLHFFLFNFYGAGRDSYAPYLILNPEGNIELSGLGIFKQDRLKRVINAKEALLFKLLKGRMQGGLYPFEARPKEEAVFSVISGGTSTSLAKRTEGLTLTYDLKLTGMLKEMPDDFHLREKKQYDKAVRQLEEQIEKDASALLGKLQGDGIDPLGIGDYVRAHSRQWEEEAFYRDEYPRMKFVVDAHIQLKESGIGE